MALVATEAASRFQREGVAHDPMTWMLAPRALFGGASALDACLDRDACLRGVLLHGLSLGLDAEALPLPALRGRGWVVRKAFDGDFRDEVEITAVTGMQRYRLPWAR